jgi:two-component system chemotaxis sensor kinase CheA
MADRPSQKALSEFLSEAQEIIEGMGKDMLRLESARKGDEPEPDVVNAVFRGAHSLKGLSGMFGVDRLSKLAHALEDLLDAVRMGRRALDGFALDLMLESVEAFSQLIGEESSGKQSTDLTQFAHELAGRLRIPSGGAAAPVPAPAPVQAAPTPAPVAPAGPDILDSLDLDAAVRAVLTEYEEHRLRANVQKGLRIYKVRVSFDLMTFDKGLADLNGRLKPHGEVVSTLPSSEVADAGGIAFEILFASKESPGSIQNAAGSAAKVVQLATRAAAPAPAFQPQAPVPVAHTPEAAPAQAVQTAAGALGNTSIRSVTQAVRVDIRKLDRLMNLVGELVLAKTNLLKLADRLKELEGASLFTPEFHRENRTLERKLNELQDGILEVRMVPLGQVFDKLQRMVRKIARDAGKEIDFRVSGSDVELDKLIVEELSDPLMHIIRNAIDHAIEQPEARAAAGKERRGVVKLAANQKANHVQITVEDDGKGIDEERVCQVAIQKGLVPAHSTADLSRREMLNFIFLPGFSTAREVTELSGRGVGLDVVKTNIANLSGIIDVHSEPGKGTRFEITLPVTLAIIRALVVNVVGRTYAVPLNAVLEILNVTPEEIRTIESREVITLRGATLPLVRLGKLFGHEKSPSGKPMFVVVVGLAQERLGIAVDDLLGQQDIVIKALGRVLQSVKGIAGATDLGNRKTVLVLDVGAIIEEVMAGDPKREAVG